MFLFLPKDNVKHCPKLEKGQESWSCVSKVGGHKINLQKSVAFLGTNNEQIEKKYRKKFPFTKASKQSNT
jgi:hypothetical protein